MQQKPQRPFVPHRSPTTPRPAITTFEFRLYTPFVPGNVGTRVGASSPAAAASEVVEAQPGFAASLRPIEDYLETEEQITALGDASAQSDYPEDANAEAYDDGDAYDGEPEEASDELPPVEHFIDQLPDVDSFAPASENARQENVSVWSGQGSPAQPMANNQSESGWIETDWQHFDWRAAAALGETPNEEASNAWATTDWDANLPMGRPLRRTAAHAIASALDEIAKQIREGDLTVSGGAPLADPATIASTLATLLGVKR